MNKNCASRPNLIIGWDFWNPINRNHNLLPTPDFRYPVNQRPLSIVYEHTVDNWNPPNPTIFDKEGMRQKWKAFLRKQNVINQS